MIIGDEEEHLTIVGIYHSTILRKPGIEGNFLNFTKPLLYLKMKALNGFSNDQEDDEDVFCHLICSAIGLKPQREQ